MRKKQQETTFQQTTTQGKEKQSRDEEISSQIKAIETETHNLQSDIEALETDQRECSEAIQNAEYGIQKLQTIEKELQILINMGQLVTQRVAKSHRFQIRF